MFRSVGIGFLYQNLNKKEVLIMKSTEVSAQKLSKLEKREKLFFMSHDNKIVPMPLNGHWNNDSGCRLDEKD